MLGGLIDRELADLLKVECLGLVVSGLRKGRDLVLHAEVVSVVDEV